MLHPIDGNTTQVFGQANQASGDGNQHTGKDYAATRNQQVRTIADGKVIHAGSTFTNAFADRFMLVRGSNASGNFVVVEHDGWYELFAHLHSISVRVGQDVRRGQEIGGAGDTGNSKGVHLHYETIDPRLIRNTYPYGRYNPDLQIAHEQRAADSRPAAAPVSGKLLTVTAPVVMVRTTPHVRADNVAPAYPQGIAKGARINVVGYVAGDDPYPLDGVLDNAWVKTVSGYYIWANGVGNDLSGLKKL